MPLPPPVHVRSTPQGVRLPDPAFTAAPGRAPSSGGLGGTVYQIEMPDHWNGRLLLFMHGFEDLRAEVGVSPPDFRRYLIGHGYAWGSSSFSSTGLIPGRAADETAALWDHFARKYGRPSFTYITGFSMGGLATHIAAERYANRFDGAGPVWQRRADPGRAGGADFFVAAAYVAGVTQAEFDASTDMHALIHDRILPALRNPAVHKRWEDIMIALTGGRALDREGFHVEEATDWRRIELSVTVQIAPNRDTKYDLGSLDTVTSDEFNRAVIRLPVNRDALHNFVEGNDTTGQLRMPLISLHTTGDGEVPIVQAQLLQRKVDAAGKRDLLVQRVMRDAGHCGFTTPEQAASFEALVRWVEHGVKPTGTNVLVADLRKLDRTFELSPRQGLPGADAVPGASDRVVVRGTATLDGASFDANYLGAVVQKAGLVTPCQYTLPPIDHGRFEITVLAADRGERLRRGGRGDRAVDVRPRPDPLQHQPAGLAHEQRRPGPVRGHVLHFGSRRRRASGRAVPGRGHPSRRPAAPPGTRVEAYVGDTLRSRVDAARRELLGIHPLGRRARFDRRMHDGSDGDLPRRRAARPRDGREPTAR